MIEEILEGDICGCGFYRTLKPNWKVKIGENVLIVVTTFGEYLSLFKDNGVVDYSIANANNSITLDNRFDFVGYDLLCREGISGLMNCGYSDNEKKTIAQIYPYREYIWSVR
ncbi:MAG: hypothetical protein K0U68_00970 [Gammaproteobacteria bacterium]|nr:hypothetical protein [Gammaproteobacteria bacterium]